MMSLVIGPGEEAGRGGVGGGGWRSLTVITLERFYAITHAMQLNKAGESSPDRWAKGRGGAGGGGGRGWRSLRHHPLHGDAEQHTMQINKRLSLYQAGESWHDVIDDWGRGGGGGGGGIADRHHPG